MKARIIEDIKRPETEIELNGKVYKCCATMNVLAEMEEIGGVSGFINNIGKISVLRKVITLLINEAIDIEAQKENKPAQYFTEKQVGQYFNYTDVKALSSKVLEAILGSLPQRKEEKLDDELADAVDSEFPDSKSNETKNMKAEQNL